MEKSKPTYWAVFQGKDVLFSGSFKECWNDLMIRYAHLKVGQLAKHDIRIARKS